MDEQKNTNNSNQEQENEQVCAETKNEEQVVSETVQSEESKQHTETKCENYDCSPCDSTPWDSKEKNSTENKKNEKANNCFLSKVAIGLIIVLSAIIICLSVQISNMQNDIEALNQDVKTMYQLMRENDAPQQSINDWLADRFQSFSDWLRPDATTDHFLPEETEPALKQPEVDEHTTAIYTDPDKSEVDAYLKHYLDTWIEKNRLDQIIPGNSEFHFSANIDGKEYNYDWSSDQQR